MFIRYAKHSGITMRSGTATASNKSMVENEERHVVVYRILLALYGRFVALVRRVLVAYRVGEDALNVGQRVDVVRRVTHAAEIVYIRVELGNEAADVCVVLVRFGSRYDVGGGNVSCLSPLRACGRVGGEPFDKLDDCRLYVDVLNVLGHCEEVRIAVDGVLVLVVAHGEPAGKACAAEIALDDLRFGDVVLRRHLADEAGE